MDLVLASASPRRALILRALGVRFRVVPADIDETLVPGEDGAVAAERLARAKAAAVSRIESGPVLAADTLVLCDGRALGKPTSPAEAGEMLRLLSGRSHEVVTGMCIAHGGVLRTGQERTTVTFAPLSAGEIDWYVATGEPEDKAGAYHIDGQGAFFIQGVNGSPSNVAGLPIRLLLQLARESGLTIGPGSP